MTTKIDMNQVLGAIFQLLKKHELTLEEIVESLGDSVIVGLSSLKKCGVTDCSSRATQKENRTQTDTPDHLCDYHLAALSKNKGIPIEWYDELEIADSIRNLSEFADAHQRHKEMSSLH